MKKIEKRRRCRTCRKLREWGELDAGGCCYNILECFREFQKIDAAEQAYRDAGS